MNRLIEANFIAALIRLAKTESDGTKEQIARVFLAFVEKPEKRGLVVQLVTSNFLF